MGVPHGALMILVMILVFALSRYLPNFCLKINELTKNDAKGTFSYQRWKIIQSLVSLSLEKKMNEQLFPLTKTANRWQCVPVNKNH